jgi:hypothetical protein
MITRVYDKKLKREIINKYTGDSFKECLLRALIDGYVKVSDVKYLSASGRSGFPVDEEYRLINKINGKYSNIPVVRKESGSNHSCLRWTKIIVKNGKATIYQEWECA